MATPAVVPALTPKVSWLKQHERMIIVALLAATFFASVGKVETILANHDASKAAVTQQALDDQKQINANLANQVTQLDVDYKDLRAMLDKQNAALAVAAAARTQALATQQATDKTLPPTELTQRWASLIGGDASDVSYSGNNYSVSNAGAVATVVTLEQVPALQANLQDAKQTVDNQAAELQKADQVQTALNAQVGGLQAQLKDADKACQAQVANVKAQARKSKMRWFGIGVGAGAALVARLLY